MMKIKYTLYDEDGIDPEDPLGDLVLSDKEGRLLTIKETFIDVWLLSFLKALMKISSGQSLQVNVLEETDQVIVTEFGGMLTFNYEDDSISAEPAEAIGAFKDAARKLVDELSHHKGVEKNASISALKALFVDQQVKVPRSLSIGKLAVYSHTINGEGNEISEWKISLRVVSESPLLRKAW